MKRIPTTVLILLLLAAACTRYQPSGAVRTSGTRDDYEDQLLRSNIRTRPEYAAWSDAGRRALRDRLTIRPSFKEMLSFSPDRATAVGYRLNLKRGQRMRVEIERATRARVFAEVFEEIGPGEPVFRLVKSARTNQSVIEFEARTDGPHVLRLQPEMFKGGEVTVTVMTAAALTFPVLGKTTRAIGSVFGDSRDGGARHHEGIDIFAPMSTPVIAAAAGTITQVNSTTRGGNVVWQEDPARNVSYYYAHLNTQDVARGDPVEAGDVIGTVGNTGNARTTPSHLHFGVYKPGRVAIDPVPFIFDQPGDLVEPVRVDLSALGDQRSVNRARVTLRFAPATDAATVMTVSDNSMVFVLGGVRDWYRVLLTDGHEGFVRASEVGPGYMVKAGR